MCWECGGEASMCRRILMSGVKWCKLETSTISRHVNARARRGPLWHNQIVKWKLLWMPRLNQMLSHVRKWCEMTQSSIFKGGKKKKKNSTKFPENWRKNMQTGVSLQTPMWPWWPYQVSCLESMAEKEGATRFVGMMRWFFLLCCKWPTTKHWLLLMVTTIEGY